MGLRFDVDPTEADWITSGLPAIHGEAVARRLLVGPDGFEAYARVLALPDPLYPGQSENDADELSADLSDSALINRIIDLVADSADGVEFVFLLWCGWPYHPDLPSGSRVNLARIREYAISRGTRRDWLTWVHSGDERWFAPGFVWPADRSWCVAYDTDSHFAGVGGSALAIDRLLKEPGMTAVPQAVGTDLPLMYE